ncbi:MAG: signal recognition particle-docking protein FtsY, partial [Ruminococcaceae bacterium]|nr:signal recognition particle-docking protein FtsY [Oscillospiraceae bacterium]
LAIKEKLGIPVRYIGVGEAIEDLNVFSEKDFCEALFG